MNGTRLSHRVDTPEAGIFRCGLHLIDDGLYLFIGSAARPVSSHVIAAVLC